MAADGFNCIRLSWVDATLSTDLPLIEQIVAAAAQYGLKVILDHHTDEAGTPADGYGSQQANGLWYDVGPGSDGTNGVGVTGTVTAAQFQADWLTVAKTFAGNSTVIGFDLDNEPLSYGNSPSGGSTWGGGGANDIHAMYQTVGDAIQAVDPGALIICEGIIGDGQNGNADGFDLTKVATDPVVLTDPNKVVYSVHDYPSSIGAEPIDSGPQAVAEMNADWGYIETDNIAPIWVGEIGASLDGTADSAGTANLADEQAWASTMEGYFNGQDGSEGGPTFSGSQQGISTDWWNWGYNPGQYPDGTLNADGSVNTAQEAVYSQFRYVPTSGTAATPSVPASGNGTVVSNTSAEIVDASGNIWTITTGAQVAVNGAADPTTANVIELAYVNGVVWQENSSDLWWSKTSPSASWASGANPLPASLSANDTVIKAGSASKITDGNGNVWSITSAGQIAVNGITDASTANVLEIAYVNGAVWQENSAGLWWSKTLPTDPWGPAAGTSVSPLPRTASANDTVVISGAATAITDAAGNVWTITSGDQVAVNGVTDTSTANVTEIAYVNGQVWQENANAMWWSKTLPTDQWGPTLGTPTSPLPAVTVPTPTPVAISVTAAGITQQITTLTTATTTVDGDVFKLTGTGVIAATLGATATTVSFQGSTPVNLTGGAAAATVTASAGVNTFTPGTGALTVTGGSGADAYVFHAGRRLLTINDFSIAKGDTLTVDKSLAASMKEASDHHGGTMITFGTGSSIDIRGMTTVPATDITFK